MTNFFLHSTWHWLKCLHPLKIGPSDDVKFMIIFLEFSIELNIFHLLTEWQNFVVINLLFASSKVSLSILRLLLENFCDEISFVPLFNCEFHSDFHFYERNKFVHKVQLSLCLVIPLIQFSFPLFFLWWRDFPLHIYFSKSEVRSSEHYNGG